MEITCQQCSTLFTVDPGVAPGGSVEAVCPGCFQLQTVLVSSPRAASASSPTGTPVSPLSDAGVADRLRDGFTLAFELRHPSWLESRRLNPFEIKRLIYERQLTGDEEFRDGVGQWFPIGEHPDFALVFRLIGQQVKDRQPEPSELGQLRFAGWKGTPPPAPAPVSALAEDAPGEEASPPPEVARRWLWVGGGLVLLAIATALFMVLP